MKSKNTFETSHVDLHIDTNAVIDKGDGLVKFENDLVITDNSEQRNGTKYDIKSMDISEYKGQITADHSPSIQEIIGKVTGLKKVDNKKVVISGIRFAVGESALAKFAYNMLKGGFLSDFSIETYGPWPDEEDNTYYDSKLVGLSMVVIGNNKSAFLKQGVGAVIKNSLEECEDESIDTTTLCKLLSNYINNSSNKMKPKKQVTKTTTENNENEKVEAKQEAVNFEEVLANALKPLMEKVGELEGKVFDKGAKEPEFKKDKDTKTVNTRTEKDYEKLPYIERHGLQVNLAWDFLKGKDSEAGQKLEEINKFHLEKLKEKDIVANAVTLGDFGNFVISPELLTDIQGFRSNYAPLVEATNWRETLSLQMSYLERNGDIDMQPVEICDDGADGNLKPVSDYAASIVTKDLEELAAVTPVCNAVTRFLAADLLQDVARGYRTDYDRKRAQLVIARLQQAINATGNTASFATTSDTNSLKAVIGALTPIAESVMNGTFILNNTSYWRLVTSGIGAGISGPLGNLFTTGDIPLLLGRPFIVVPDDLMPTLDTGNTNKTFVVDGANVTINQGLIYADLTFFTGRTSGGLNYDLSTEAAYEEAGVVKSAYQRNELVLRGSFFRGGAFTDDERAAGLGAPGVS